MNPPDPFPDPAWKPILGVDGGGTKTRAVVVDKEDQILWRSEAGPANCRSQSPEQVDTLLDTLYAQAQETVGPLEGAGIGLAGIVDAERAGCIAARCVRDWGLRDDKVVVDSDLRMSHGAAFPEGRGILLIGGTGSSCLGRNGTGQWHQCGGWGALIDDAGSGYRMGLEALQLAVQGMDGRRARPDWAHHCLESLGVRDIRELVSWIHEGPDRKKEVAALAPLVMAQEEAGDTEATLIVDQAVEALCRLVTATASVLSIVDPAIALQGRVAQRLSPRLEKRLRAVLSGARIVSAAYPPEFGGVLAVRRHWRAGEMHLR